MFFTSTYQDSTKTTVRELKRYTAKQIKTMGYQKRKRKKIEMKRADEMSTKFGKLDSR